MTFPKGEEQIKDISSVQEETKITERSNLISLNIYRNGIIRN
jgi:hypothetical protein